MSRQSFDHNADAYADIAAYYDLEHDHFADDIQMYRHVVDMVGDPVVEFACGSGRILERLAEPGRRLTGIDSSEIMLERCRGRFRPSIDPPTLLLQDMAATDLPVGHFGVVIIGLNSLMHAATPARQRATLECAHRALDPRGLLVVDLINPLLNLHDAGDGRVRSEDMRTIETGEMVSKFSTQSIDPATQILSTSIWYDVVDQSGALSRTSTSMQLRFMYQSELALALEAAGFPGVQFYGTYELDPYTSESPQLIAFAERS